MILALALSAVLTAPTIDVKVDGEGYLRLIREGRAVYAKHAKLTVTNGKLSDEAGDPILPSVPIPNSASRIEIDLEGTVFAIVDSSKLKAGQLVLASFSNDAILQPNDGLLISSERPHLGSPGEESFGVIRFSNGTGEIKHAVMGESAQKSVETPKFVIPSNIADQFTKNAVTNLTKTTDPGYQAPNRTAKVTIADHATAAGDHIFLSDIAALEGEKSFVGQLGKVDLGETPPTGIKRVFDRQRIQIKIRAAGLRPEDVTIIMPPTVEVRRQAQVVQASRFVTLAVQAILDKGGPVGAWECTDSFTDLEVPSGRIELKPESVSGEQTGTAWVVVGIYIAGDRFNSRTVHLHLKDLAPPIRPGAAVKVILTAGHAQVEVSGIAKTAGRLGDTIQVQVTMGNPPVVTFHTGTLIGAGLVQVRL